MLLIPGRGIVSYILEAIFRIKKESMSKIVAQILADKRARQAGKIQTLALTLADSMTPWAAEPGV